MNSLDRIEGKATESEEAEIHFNHGPDLNLVGRFAQLKYADYEDQELVSIMIFLMHILKNISFR